MKFPCVFEELLYFCHSICPHCCGRPSWCWLVFSLRSPGSPHITWVQSQCDEGVNRVVTKEFGGPEHVRCMGNSDPWRALFLSISVHCHLPFIFFPSNPQYTPKQKQQTLPTAHSVQPGLKKYWSCIYSSFYPNLSTLPRLILLCNGG